MGGLGNQMFQIAAAFALAIRNNTTYGFNFDECYTPLQGNPSPYYSETIFKKVNKINGTKFDTFYKEKSHSFSPIPFSENLLLDGYFQSEKYFKDVCKLVINLFEISKDNVEIVKSVLNLSDKRLTSVHIRRGDYLKFPNVHPTCDLEYYKKAMSLITDSIFVVISDDMKWVKENLIGDNIIYSPFKDELLDLTLMTICDNNIIANSSFSWWGAYLNNNKSGFNKIIAPKNWFGPNGPQDIHDIVPTNWIKI